jgi:hypothetical protein
MQYSYSQLFQKDIYNIKEFMSSSFLKIKVKIKKSLK